MALQGSGQIKLTELATEFGDTAPHGLKEFYNGGGRVPSNSNNSAVPSSGAISIQNFYNAANFVVPVATGGTIVTLGNTRYHIFTASGDFVLTTPGSATYEVLCIAGGGGTGGDIAGGAGGGGYVYASGTIPANTYALVIGGGGGGAGSGGTGGQGIDSTGMGLTAKGGGRSVGYRGAGGPNAGGSVGGGRSAGGGTATQPSQAHSPVTGLTVSQNLGNAAGASVVSAGGGGAGGAGNGLLGGAATTPAWDNIASSINVSASVMGFGGGGGGGTDGGTTNAGGVNAGTGGQVSQSGTAGRANFGGGGGGGGWINGTVGGAGGAGVFIVKYNLV